MKSRALITMLLALALTASSAAAGDFEYSPRGMALADTGNAIFNNSYFPPVFENIATVCESPKYYIGGEMRGLALYGIGSTPKRDYNQLDATGGGMIKTAYPFGEDSEDDWTGRVGLLFEPGVQMHYLRVRAKESDTKLDLTDSRIEGTPSFRIGAAYGIHQIFAMGIGLTFMPTTIFYNNFQGTQNTPDGSSNVDFQDAWSMTGPFMVQPEIGFLWRTYDGMQFGLNYELGYTAHTKQTVKHTTADGDIRWETDAAVIKPNSIGIGWAYQIPDIDKFFVAADFDIYFHQSYTGSTYDDRDYYRTNFTRDKFKSKNDPNPTQARDPNGYADSLGNMHTIGNRFYASTPARYNFSASIEKGWETIGLRGGIGYNGETGLTKDRPITTFYGTVGPSLFFDETIFLNAAGRMDLGFARAETTYFVFGAGVAISLGGTF